VRRRRPSARILVIHLARGMALGRGGIDTRFWLDAALLPGGTWPLAGASKKTALRLTARLTQSFWVEHMVSLRALSFCDDQPCRRRGGRVWGGGRLPYLEACRRLLVELKLATLTEAGQHFCLVFENVPLLVQTQGPLRQSHPYDWRSKKSVADRGDWASDFDAQGPNFVLLPATLSQLLLAFLCLHPASHAKPSQLGTQNANSKNVNSTRRKEVRNMIA
jgi:hypothetical protein